MRQIKSWIEAMRLRTLPVSIAGVLTAWAFNIADGSIVWSPAVLCLIFALLCQVASNFANEYYDYAAGRDRAGREGPRRGVTEGDISPKAMKCATFALLTIAALVGLSLTYWGGLWLIAVGVLIALGVLAYSTGPWPLSTHAMGEVAVVFFFGVIPVSFTYYVQALTIPLPVLLASVAMGLMGANVLIVNNYRDADDDILVGKRTLANTLPSKAMPFLYLGNAMVAMLLFYPIWHNLHILWLAIPIIYIIVAAMIAKKMSRLTGRQLNPLLGQTAISMLVVAILLNLAVIIL